MLGTADRALYQAKSQGKGQMVVISVPPQSPAG